MAYRYEQNKDTKKLEIIVDGFDNGIGSSPHKGLANLKNINITTESGEAMCSYNRVQQAQTVQGTGTLTVTGANTVSITGATVLPGSWIHIVADSGTGLSGDYFYLGNNQFSATFSRSTSSAVTVGATTVFLTSGTSYTTPAGWSNSSNTIETIGASGGSDYNAGSATGGAGGGAYSKTTNVTMSGSITYQIGAGGQLGSSGQSAGAGTDTYFNGASLGVSSVGAKGGSPSVGGTAGAGGTSGSGVGTTKYSGGNGANNVGGAGGGGGGAAGPSGAGANAVAGAGGTGDNGAGGAGGAAGNPPVAGSAGTEMGSSKGSGGGGGGATGAQQGGTGGLYGGAPGGQPAATTGVAGKAGLIKITYTDTTTTATFTTYTMGSPIQSATEPYRDSSNVQQYRYYILDNLGQVWVYDTQTYAGITNPAWAMIEIVSLAGRVASGLAVLNGWVSITLDNNFYWIPTCSLNNTILGTTTLVALTKNIHTTLVGHQGKMYYTDGNFIGSLFPNTSLINTSNANLQSYCQFTAATTTGTVSALIGGSYPNYSNGSTTRIPVWFVTDGTKPAAITLSTIYYIKWLNSGVTFEVYAAGSGGSAIDIQTGSSGNQFFNTFNPIYGSAAYTFTPQVLNLPFFETSQSLAEVGNFVIVGGTSNTLYPWDQVTTTPNNLIPLPEGDVVNLITVNNSVYIFCGNNANIYITNGSSASRVLTVPDYCAGIAGTPSSYVEPYFSWGGVMYLEGRIWFSLLDQTATKTGNCGGIWSFTPTQNFYIEQDIGLALRVENQSSYGTYNGTCPVLLPNQTQTAKGSQYWNAWYSSISSPTYGIDFSDTITTPSAIIETDLIPTGTALQKQTLSQIEYKLASPLASGETVTCSYRQNGTASFVSCGTFITETVTDLSGYLNVNFEQGQWLQLQITLNPLASSSSSFIRLKEIIIR